MVYMNLRPPAGTARRSPAGWWSLTPPSHPYPPIFNLQPSIFNLQPSIFNLQSSTFNLQPSIFNLKRGGGHSLLPLPAVADCFYFQKWSTLCRPDFPPAQSSIFNNQSSILKRASDRPEQCFQRAKLRKVERKTKEFILFFAETWEFP